MKKFRITVDGHEYLVEVEPITEDGPTPSAAPVAKPANITNNPKPVAKPPAQTKTGGVMSPMPGTVLKILVNPGERVDAGQALFILEAMKMENKIPAPQAGVVQEIHVSQGQNVDTGQHLLTLEA